MLKKAKEGRSKKSSYIGSLRLSACPNLTYNIYL